MVVKLAGSVTEERSRHSVNASSPMVVTLAGISTEVRFQYPLNAFLPMVVTPDGIAYQPEIFLGTCSKVFIFLSNKAPLPSLLK